MSKGKVEDQSGYSGQEEDRDALGEENKSILLHLIKQVRIGMDLSRVTLPAFILEPLSFLEKLTDFFYFSDDLIDIQDMDNDFDKIYAFTRFSLCGLNINPPRGIKKPYNPILGERYFCVFEHKDKSLSRYLVEQVCHHPPISAFRMNNVENGWSGEGTVMFKSRFLGNSVACYIYGSTALDMPKTGDKFKVTFPSYYARGILFGKLLMETVGKISIDFENSDYASEIDFKPKGFFRGEYNSVKGKIWRKSDGEVLRVLNGRWSEKVYICSPKDAKLKDEEKDVLYDSSDKREDPKREDPIEDLGIWESQKLWKKITDGLKNGDIDYSEDGKFELEESQRKGHRERESAEIEWEPFFFTDKETEEVIDGTTRKQFFIRDKDLLKNDVDVIKALVGRNNEVFEKLKDHNEYFASSHEDLLERSRVPHHENPRVPVLDKKEVDAILKGGETTE